jgi:arylsulfatase
MGGRTSLTVYEGMVGMSENVFINLKNQSHNITAEVNVPAGGAKGVLLAQAGRFGGWSLYLKDGRPVYTYNFLGLKRFTVASKTPVAPGKATIRFEFAYDGGGLGKGGLGTILVNGQKVAEGRIDATQPMFYSADEGADVGEDGETPVVDDYGIPAPYRFTGTIDKITLDVKDMKPPEKAAADKARLEVAHKRALVD